MRNTSGERDLTSTAWPRWSRAAGGSRSRLWWPSATRTARRRRLRQGAKKCRWPSRRPSRTRGRTCSVPRKHGTTITHQVLGHYGAGRVLLRPASPGTGVIAGGGVRALLELGGVHDVLTKCLGTTNPINMVRAAEAGLRVAAPPEDIAVQRGKTGDAKVLGLDQRDSGRRRDRRRSRRQRRPGEHDDVSEDHAGQERDQPAKKDHKATLRRPRHQPHGPDRLPRGHSGHPGHGAQGRVHARGAPRHRGEG